MVARIDRSCRAVYCIVLTASDRNCHYCVNLNTVLFLKMFKKILYSNWHSNDNSCRAEYDQVNTAADRSCSGLPLYTHRGVLKVNRNITQIVVLIPVHFQDASMGIQWQSWTGTCRAVGRHVRQDGILSSYATRPTSEVLVVILIKFYFFKIKKLIFLF